METEPQNLGSMQPCKTHRASHNRVWLGFAALVATLAIGGFSLWQRTQRPWDLSGDDLAAKRCISRLIRDFNGQYENGPAQLLDRFIRSNPEFFRRAGQNGGAEALVACGFQFQWTSDTDGDGRLEASDPHGNPIIFLCEAHTSDDVLSSAGELIRVSMPAYCRRGCHYISLLRDYCWFDEGSYSKHKTAIDATIDSGTDKQTH